MIWFVISIIITIVIMGGIFLVEEKFTPKMLIGLVGLLVMIPGFIGIVATGEVGIKTAWGKVTSTNLQEGLQIKAPWEKIIKMNIKVQKYENTKENALETSTKDMQVVNNVIVATNYQLNPDKAVDLYRQVGEDYQETILNPAIQESIKSEISKYSAEELITKRSEVSEAILKSLKTKVDEYGINILSVSLKDFNFSAEYNASIERKTIAEQNSLTAKQELETSKANAEKKKIEAQAEADANKILEATLTDKVLQQQFIEKWNGELPKVTSDNGILDITGILGK